MASIFGGGRSRQELAEDQLAEVNQAVSEGRTEVVDLGQTAGVDLAFRGGFDENSTFFDVGGTRDLQEQVAQILVDRFGFDQARVVEDGVIRLEDFSREFSDSHETIVSEIQASIVDVQIGFSEAERSIISSLGSALGEIDSFVDASSGTALSATQVITQAYSQAFDSTLEEAQLWLSQSGIDADRYVEIFGSASGEVLNQLVGVSSAANNSAFSMSSAFNASFSSFSDGLVGMGQAANSSFSSIEGGLIGLTGVAFQQAQQVSAAYDSALQGAGSSLELVVNNNAESQQSRELQEAAAAMNNVSNRLDDVVPFIQQQAAGS